MKKCDDGDDDVGYSGHDLSPWPKIPSGAGLGIRRNQRGYVTTARKQAQMLQFMIDPDKLFEAKMKFSRNQIIGALIFLVIILGFALIRLFLASR